MKRIIIVVALLISTGAGANISKVELEEALKPYQTQLDRSIGAILAIQNLIKKCEAKEVEPVEEEQAEETREPAPEPVQDTAVEQEVYNYEEYGTIFIATLPPIAEVYVDSNYIGQTNVTKLRGPLGTHLWKFVREDKSLEKEITLKPGENPPLLLRFQE